MIQAKTNALVKADEVFEGIVVEDVEPLPGDTKTIEDFVSLWREAESGIESRQWRLAKIADTLVGRYEDGVVGQFALEVDYARSRIYQLSKAWRLRASMQEHAHVVGSRANGRQLTVSHFYEASLVPDKARELIRAATEKNWSGNRVKQEATEIRLAREISARTNDELSPASRGEVDREAGAVELGENLQRLRRGKNLSVEVVARTVGVNRASLDNWESGHCLPTLMPLAKLCGFYEVTLDLVAGHLVPVPDYRSTGNRRLGE